MTSRGTQDSVQYVELPPFEPSETRISRRSNGTREAKDSRDEHPLEQRITTLPAQNPFAHGRGSSVKAARRGYDASDSGGGKAGRGNVTVLSSVNPFAEREHGRGTRAKAAPRRGSDASDSVDEKAGRDGVIVLGAVNPFAERELSTQDPSTRSRGTRVKATLRRGHDASDSGDGEAGRGNVTVLSSTNPFAEREHDRGSRAKAAPRRRHGSDASDSGDEEAGRDGVMISSSVTPFAEREHDRGSRAKAAPRRGHDASDSGDWEAGRGNVTVLSSANPFAEREHDRGSRVKAAPRRGHDASHSGGGKTGRGNVTVLYGSDASDSGDEEAGRDGVMVLSSATPFGQRERGGGMRAKAPRRESGASDRGDEETGRDGAILLPSVNPFAERELSVRNPSAKNGPAIRRQNGRFLPALEALQVDDPKEEETRTTTRRAQDTVYVELPPFSSSDVGPSRRSNRARETEVESADVDSGVEYSRNTRVVELPRENRSVHGGGYRVSAGISGELDGSDGESGPQDGGNDWDGVIMLPDFNPFGERRL
ncbi:hypothetical protein FRC10_008979 [Ceratobasidium sp. 414]|nr:hypothetical protein FRC10_008979 [Ceratobasidium sp. 414]